MRRFASLKYLAVAVVVAAAALAASPAGAQFVSNYLARTFTSTAPSGTNGFACRVAGCRLDLGPGASDYLYSDATWPVRSPGAIRSDTSLYAPAVTAASYATTNLGGSGLVFQGGAITGGLGMRFYNWGALTTAGDRLASFESDNAGTARLQIWGPGGVTFPPSTLPTCGGTGTPEGTFVTVAGAGATRTKVCACTFTPTGSVWAWVNLTTNNAGTGTGTTTTCP